METNQAAENLQVIRTLMERSALYRRALAPIMTFVGVVGVLAAVVGLNFHLVETWQLFGLWPAAALVAVTGAFLIARRQALKDREPFWSPPTKRISQALCPPFTAGLCLSLACKVVGFEVLVPFIWALFYGCALHSAGFFMTRGMKWFGWIFVGIASAIICFLAFSHADLKFHTDYVHWFMGFCFGALQLAYGAYLYLTEQRKNVA